jgi:mannose-6-phosphate isomerase-like protein (cupin superfamily)
MILRCSTRGCAVPEEEAQVDAAAEKGRIESGIRRDFRRSNMKRIAPLVFAATFVLGMLAVLPLSSQGTKPQPLTLPLECASGDCPLLHGVPQTAGMRSGFVRLKPGESVGWHTTGKNEESLVVLHGRGEARLEGQSSLAVTAPVLVYIPPATRHNVANTGTELLEYVYVVAPAKEP